MLAVSGVRLQMLWEVVDSEDNYNFIKVKQNEPMRVARVAAN